MLTAKNLKQEYMRQLVPHDYAAGQVRYILETMDDVAEKVSQDNGYAVFWNKKIIACGGVIPMWDGRATVWGIIDKSVVGSSMIWVHRFVKEHIDDALESRFHRLEMTVNMDFPQGSRWAEMLGFEFEGILKQYDPWRNDHIMYARTR